MGAKALFSMCGKNRYWSGYDSACRPPVGERRASSLPNNLVVDEEKTLTEVKKVKRIPLIERLRRELSAAVRGESSKEIFRLVDRLEEALWCFLAVEKLRTDDYPEQVIRKKLSELGLLK